jgi:hypothetical protein
MYFLHIYANGTLKPVEIILRREVKRENNGEDEPNWVTLCSYMEMPQQNLLCNY